MKKTSVAQFNMMVTYMEEHGDLSKPSSNARGKVQALNHWEELANLLNSDGTGDTKAVEKWKKVWSDLKNNTKRKAARLHKAASGTGGGPANLAQLTDLEQRVLAIIGVQAATGLAGVAEAGFSQNLAYENVAGEISCVIASPPQSGNTHLRVFPNMYFTPPRELQIESPTVPNTPNRTGSTEMWDQPGPSRLPHLSPPQPQRNHHPVAVHSGRADLEAVSPQQTVPASARSSTLQPRRVMSSRPRTSPQRRTRHTSSIADQAAHNFLHSDSEWRKFRMEQHRAQLELEKEKIRIRELELEVNRGWQVLGSGCIDILEKLASKLDKEK